MPGKEVSFREQQRRAWEREYARKGALWAGPSLFKFGLEPGSKVLELGCGNGKTLADIVKSNCAITAVDASQKAVELCQNLAAVKGWEGVKVTVADACELPFSASSFDAAVAFHILESLLAEDREKAAKEIRRVLKPGGKAFVQVFSTNDMRFGKGKEIEEGTFVRGQGIATHYFTEEELDVLFKEFRKVSKTLTRKGKKYRGKELIRERIVAVYEKQ